MLKDKSDIYQTETEKTIETERILNKIYVDICLNRRSNTTVGYRIQNLHDRAEMSIAAENLPLPRRRRFKNLIPRRAAIKVEATAPLPHRDALLKKPTAAAPLPPRYL